MDAKRSYKIRKDEVKTFIGRYIDEYRRYLEEKHPERKDESDLYSGYPYHVTAYVGERTTLIECQLNSSKLTIKTEKVKKEPTFKRRKGYVATSYANRYLKRILDQPEMLARRDIEEWISHEEFEKQEAEHWQRLMEQYFQQNVEWTVKNYISYIKTSYDVSEKTSSIMKAAIYDIVKKIHNQGIMLESYLMCGCLTLIDISIQVTEDIESSLFLALHGKYGPAMALLRRYLETMVIALHFDADIARYDRNSRTFDSVKKKRDKWVEKSFHMRFTGDFGVLERLIDPDTDYIALETLRRTDTHFNGSSFRAYLKKLYGRLSKFVHYGGTRPIGEISSLEFAEFNEDRFKEWYTRFSQIFEICNLLTVTKFPSLLSIYDEKQQDLNPEDQVPLLTNQQIQVLKNMINSSTG